MKFTCLIGAAAIAPAVSAGEVTVAVAANFRAPLEAVAEDFSRRTGHEVVITSGSTGQLYAQIRSGAPFDLLLAADQERPRRLADEGLGDPASIFTYAIGQLALWSRQEGSVGQDSLAELARADFRWLAIAEPALAPYGRAARQTLESLGLWETLQPRLVKGQNVAQAFAMAETQNADLGLIALSQALAYSGPATYVIVPATAHEPIRQDAIVLKRAAANPAAIAFSDYLRDDGHASRIIGTFGYLAPVTEQTSRY